MRHKLNEGYEGFYVDDESEDQRLLADTQRCVDDLAAIFKGYEIEDGRDDSDFWIAGSKGISLFVHARNGDIKRAEFELQGLPDQCSLMDLAAAGDFLRDVHDVIRREARNINGILEYMRRNGLSFNAFFS